MLPVAWLAYRFFETPLRFAPYFTSSIRRTFLFAAGGTVLLLATAFLVGRGGAATNDGSERRVAHQPTA